MEKVFIPPGFIQDDSILVNKSIGEYGVYLEEIFKLAKTMVIHSTESADAVNAGIITQYGSQAVNAWDKTTWKYYQNISGEYHWSDTPMQIVSIDTLETIDFTVDNLKVHTSTWTAYQYGSRYYNNLLALHPDQEQLILGILYPVDIDTAINADEWKILFYDRKLVAENEDTLIDDLQSWINRFQMRWHNKDYHHADPYYQAAQHAILYMQLPLVIANLRLKRIHTNEVHSFHIKQHLASNYRLRPYVEYMTLKQQLYLYRNIRYLERHAGYQDNLDQLIDVMLTQRNIPISSYTIKHTDEYTTIQDQPYYFKKSPINTQFNTPEKDFYSLDEILTKLKPVAINNEYVLPDKIDDTIQRSKSGIVQTKMLESILYDYSNSEPYTLPDVLLSQWAYMTTNNLYTAHAIVKDPRGNDLILSVTDSFIFALYIASVASGQPLTHIPRYRATRVRTDEPLMLSIVTNTQEEAYQCTDFAQAMIDSVPPMRTIESTQFFFDTQVKLHQAMLRQWRAIACTGNKYIKAYLENTSHQLYRDMILTPKDFDTAYTDWFVNKGIEVIDYTPAEALTFYQMLFEASTGYTIDPTKVLGYIHTALINVIKTISSYSVQFLHDTNTSPVKLIDWSVIRSDIPATDVSDVDSFYTPIDMTDMNTIVTGYYGIKYLPSVTIEACNSDVSQRTDISLPELVNADQSSFNQELVPIFSTTVIDDTICEEESLSNYSSLTAEQSLLLKDLYHTTVVQPTVEANVYIENLISIGTIPTTELIILPNHDI